MKTDISEFYTEPASEAGVKVELYTPTGTKTEHWLKIIGKDSKAFRKAESITSAKKLELLTSKRDTTNDEEGLFALRVDLLSRCVIGWSFEGECTVEAVAELFFKAPALAEQVDTSVGDRKLFTSGSASS